jgi:HD superfamily phosphohydrolase
VSDLESRIGALIRGRSKSPLAGLISGSLDLDKIEYLSRDARMCGVPYGAVDVARLISALSLISTERGPEIGVHEKGVSALESLLFAKYQMYRNVYWHHAVRSATCMFKRAVGAAVLAGNLTAEAVAGLTDGGLMERLFVADPSGLALAVHQRRLYKRALDLPASEVPEDAQPWLWEQPGPARKGRGHVRGTGGTESREKSSSTSRCGRRCWVWISRCVPGSGWSTG